MPWTSEERSRIEVSYNGEVATIVFNKARLTPRWISKTQEQDSEAVSRALLDVIVEWGPVDDAGTLAKPTLDQLLDVPFAAQVNLARKLIEELGPSSEEKNASSKPSPTTAAPAESSSTDSPSFQNGSTSSQTPSPSPDVSSAPSSS